MKRQYMGDEDYAQLITRPLGTVGAWQLFAPPADWNDCYIWACDGYWAIPVSFKNKQGQAVMGVMQPEESVEIIAFPSEYTLSTDPGIKFDWNKPGQVNKTWAFLIPKDKRSRFAIAKRAA